MPDPRRPFIVRITRSRLSFPAAQSLRPLFQLTGCRSTLFGGCPGRANPRIRLGGWSFQKINFPLRNPPVFTAKPIDLCVAQIFLTLLCIALYIEGVRGAG